MAKLVWLALLLVAALAQYAAAEGDEPQDYPPHGYYPHDKPDGYSPDGYYPHYKPDGHGDSIPPWLYPYLRGKDGRIGRDGEKGAKGDKGPLGPKGMPGDPGMMGPPGMSGDMGSKGDMGPPGDMGIPGGPGMQGMPGPDGQVLSGGASVYTKWGSTECPGSATFVYSGRAASPRFSNAGGGAQYLCLPSADINIPTIPTNPLIGGLSTLVGVHFETNASPSEFPGGEQNIEPLQLFDRRAVVCAVCFSDNSAAIMIPNKRDCPMDTTNVDWNLEYTGYLMTARDFIFIPDSDIQQGPVFGGSEPAHFRTEYVCVCQTPSMEDMLPIDGPYEAELAHTRLHCRFPGLGNVCGQFPCSPEDGTCTFGPLSCAVCTGSTP